VAAVGAALAVVLLVLANFFFIVAASFLVLAAVSYYIVFEKAGIVHGVLCILVATGISFAFGFSGAQILNLLLFAPYSVIAYFMRHWKYDDKKKWKWLPLRILVVIVFANLVLMGVFFLAGFMTSELQIHDIIETFGGYVVVAVLVSLGMIAVDILFYLTSTAICKRMKLGQ